jgi:hypothetical protein
MKKCLRLLIIIAGMLFFTTGCEDDGSTGNVRFQNNSTTRTVCPIWDGFRAATLAPGQTSEYRVANPGTHTLQWNDPNGKALTSMAWPNLVDGKSYTFPYNY